MRPVKTRRGLLARLSQAVGAAVALSLPAPRVVARAAAGDPAAFVQGFADAVLAALRDRRRSRAERLRAVEALAEGGFALDGIARVALGRHWRAASPAEREEFSALFKAAVLASYGRRFDEYADRRVRVGAVAPAGDGQVMVESLVGGGSTPVRLDWRLVEADGRWRVLDVVAEGVSLVVTYRNEFAAVIERGGGRVSALLAELRTRAAGATG